MISSNPYTDPETGHVYDRLHVALTMQSRVKDGQFTAQVSARFVPFRMLEDGRDERREDLAKGVAFHCTKKACEGCEHADAAITAIRDALQGYIDAKGI